MMYPMPASPATSPRWQGPINVNMAHLPLQPPTPPRNGIYGVNGHAFRGMGGGPPLHTGGDRSTSGSISDGNPVGLGGAGLRNIHAGQEGQPPMNARWVLCPSFCHIPKVTTSHLEWKCTIVGEVRETHPQAVLRGSSALKSEGEDADMWVAEKRGCIFNRISDRGKTECTRRLASKPPILEICCYLIWCKHPLALSR
jgi:hypothetical protein